MSPTLDKVYIDAYHALYRKTRSISCKRVNVLRDLCEAFMLKQTREADIAMFANVAKMRQN
jgi:flagellar biosynthesis protein FliP